MAGLETIVPVITAIITALVTFFVSRHTNKKDITINDRQQLSKDEQQFRAELREELRMNREKVDLLQEQVTELKEVNVKLEIKVEQLTEINTKLENENRMLSIKVDDLMTELRNKRGNE